MVPLSVGFTADLRRGCGTGTDFTKDSSLVLLTIPYGISTFSLRPENVFGMFESMGALGYSGSLDERMKASRQTKLTLHDTISFVGNE